VGPEGRVRAQPPRRGGAEVVVVDQGQPDDDFTFDPWASYAIVEAASVEFRRVAFDLDELDRITREAGMPLAGEVFERYRRS
jgi:hypothetical protein